jgi:NodT family efflux transporter outer membrane factor (OMF) lipoprotein
MVTDGRTDIMLLRSALVIVVSGILLIACAVGPDFHRPDAPDVSAYTSQNLPGKTASASVAAGEAQYFLHDMNIPDQWWTVFRSQALDQVIRMALSDNPTLASARATLRKAQEDFNAQFGAGRIPSVDAKASATREKFSGASFGQPGGGTIFNLYNVSVNVSYLLDPFGSVSRELEALQSQIDFERFQLEGSYLTLTSNIVTTAVKEASLREQIRATEEIVTLQKNQLSLVEQQFELGGVSRSDVLTQRTQLAQTLTTLPPLKKDLSKTRHLISVLAGKFPADASSLPVFNLDGLTLPQNLPVSLPSSLVRQRPDIRAAEALLHAASAQVGVSTANLYPQIKISGMYGTEATKTHNLFESGTMIWNIGMDLLQPVFHGGELTSKRRAAIAAYEQSLAQYHETVLQAFQNVADVLRTLEEDAETLNAESTALQASNDVLDLTQKQFQLGAVSYLSLLNAQRQYQQAIIGLAQAQAARFADTAALFQALGGGWWNRTTEAEAEAMKDME